MRDTRRQSRYTTTKVGLYLSVSKMYLKFIWAFELALFQEPHIFFFFLNLSHGCGDTLLLLLLQRLHSRLSGSPVWIILLHSCLSRTSSSFLAISLRSSSMQSCHLPFGLPLLLLPTARFLILLPTYDSSLLIMWPNHLNLVSRNFYPSSTTPVLLLTSSFLIQSSPVLPMDNLNISISATSIFFLVF